ncbi:MAG: hypothetical protein OXH79_16450 [Boseongicola sp.]|nr:hypothetical protein [Boseongicola sp.]
MSGTRDGGRRKPDLMATRPGAGAALEAMRRDVAKLGEAQAGRPDPATREELEAWGTKLLEGVAEAVSVRTEPMTREELEETVTGLADRIVAATAPDLEPAAGTGGAAGPDEAATEDGERTVREQLERIVHLLMCKRLKHDVTPAP